MAANSSNIVVPGNLVISVAPLGTAAPADETSAYPSGWTDLGFTQPDASKFTTSPTFEEVRSHQSDFPTRVIKTGDALSVETVLQEFSRQTLTTVFGGGTLTTVAAGKYRYDPPATGASVPVTIGLDWTDGATKFRLIVPRARARNGVEVGLNKTAETGLPLSLSAEGVAGQSAWYLLTNLAALA